MSGHPPHQREAIVRQVIASPADMLIGSNQRQIATIKLARFLILDIDNR
jgi:hypothetical protein